MFSSAELIEALRRRMRRSLRPPRPLGEFPPGWREWFAAMAERPGRVSGATAGEVIAAAAAREPAIPPGIVDELGHWRAFATLWRQEWQPATRDERWTRITAMTGSLLLHLLFGIALVWLMLARFYFPAPEADARDGEEHVLQVEYIGEGTPADMGGGAYAAPVESPDAPAPAAATAPAARSASIPAAPPSPEIAPAAPTPLPSSDAEPPPLVAERPVVVEVPELAPPVVPAPDVLQVTVVDVPDTTFVVPPPRELALPTVDAREAPEVAVRRREIDVQARPEIQAPGVRPTREVEVAAPQVSPRGVAVVTREVELAETAEVSVRASRDAPAISTRDASVQAPAVRERAVPIAPARPAPAGPEPGAAERGQASATRPAEGEGRSAAPASTPPGGRPEAGSGARSAGTAPGAGPRPGQPPGALPSTRASDDWGDSTRNVPGRQAGTPGASGLFNADGSPRLAGGGRVGAGLPPGTITEDFENIDRRGTWLKRPPIGYEPTSFDRFWLPSESLLEEWVRKSVTEVRIPIPGTTKSIRCVTVMLALGGACDILDPNLGEQSATARKPPDVPFKRELQEDQSSLGSPPEP